MQLTKKILANKIINRILNPYIISEPIYISRNNGIKGEIKIIIGIYKLSLIKLNILKIIENNLNNKLKNIFQNKNIILQFYNINNPFLNSKILSKLIIINLKKYSIKKIFLYIKNKLSIYNIHEISNNYKFPMNYYNIYPFYSTEKNIFFVVNGINIILSGRYNSIKSNKEILSLGNISNNKLFIDKYNNYYSHQNGILGIKIIISYSLHIIKKN